jgi:hypothetical protein
MNGFALKQIKNIMFCLLHKSNWINICLYVILEFYLSSIYLKHSITVKK